MYSVASTTSKASIDERLEHELETNSRSDEEEERRGKRLRYRRKRASFFASFHIWKLGQMGLISVFNWENREWKAGTL